MAAGGAKIFLGKQVINMLGQARRNRDRNLPAYVQNSSQLRYSLTVIVHVLDHFGADDLVESFIGKGKAKGVSSEKERPAFRLLPLFHLSQNVSGFQQALLAEVHAQNGAFMAEAFKGVPALAAARVEDEVSPAQRDLAKINGEHR
jgi:hypothetical protein